MDVERWALKDLGAQDLIAFGKRNGSKKQADALFCFLDRRDNGVEILPIAGVEFGME